MCSTEGINVLGVQSDDEVGDGSGSCLVAHFRINRVAPQRSIVAVLVSARGCQESETD
jgi:hypothetical protein